MARLTRLIFPSMSFVEISAGAWSMMDRSFASIFRSAHSARSSNAERFAGWRTACADARRFSGLATLGRQFEQLRGRRRFAMPPTADRSKESSGVIRTLAMRVERDAGWTQSSWFISCDFVPLQRAQGCGALSRNVWLESRCVS